MEAVTMMRNVLTTLSLSVLFAISGCAVDEPTDEDMSGSSQQDDMPMFESGGRDRMDEKKERDNANEPTWPRDGEYEF